MISGRIQNRTTLWSSFRVALPVPEGKVAIFPCWKPLVYVEFQLLLQDLQQVDSFSTPFWTVAARPLELVFSTLDPKGRNDSCGGPKCSQCSQPLVEFLKCQLLLSSPKFVLCRKKGLTAKPNKPITDFVHNLCGEVLFSPKLTGHQKEPYERSFSGCYCKNDCASEGAKRCFLLEESMCNILRFNGMKICRFTEVHDLRDHRKERKTPPQFTHPRKAHSMPNIEAWGSDTCLPIFHRFPKAVALNVVGHKKTQRSAKQAQMRAPRSRNAKRVQSGMAKGSKVEGSRSYQSLVTSLALREGQMICDQSLLS